MVASGAGLDLEVAVGSWQFSAERLLLRLLSFFRYVEECCRLNANFKINGQFRALGNLMSETKFET